MSPMDVFTRGLQAYLVGLALIAALCIVWATNAFVLNNTAAGTGWPLMAAIAAALVLLGVMIRRRWWTTNRDSTLGRVPW